MSWFAKKPAQREGAPDRATASGGPSITALITGSAKCRRANWEIWNRMATDFDLVDSYDKRMAALPWSERFLKHRLNAELKASLTGHYRRDAAEALYMLHELKARGLSLGRFVGGGLVDGKKPGPEWANQELPPPEFSYQAPKRPTWEEYLKQHVLLRAPRCLCPGIHDRPNPGTEPPLPSVTLADIISLVNGGVK